MNSHRLEQIISELMRPIGDIRHSFDTDLCALLEEYLTEAGLRALDGVEGVEGAEVDNYVESSLPVLLPNFSELALLLQHSASIYERKVDLLYQCGLNLSDSLHNCTIEATASGDEPQTPASRSRKRKQSSNGFESIMLEECAGARREPSTSRPPPTLPRLYLQLEPRVLTACDAQLVDYAGEPIGMLDDLHVTWRLQEGLLVEELAEPPRNKMLREVTSQPLPVEEMQTAMDECTPSGSPPRCSTPLPINPTETNEGPQLDDEKPQSIEMLDLAQAPEIPHKQRKRKNENNLEDMEIAAKLIISEELRLRLQTVEEFCLPEKWITKVVERRKRRILEMRRKMRDHEHRPPSLGFLGWTSTEAAAARAAAKRAEESDDDGFFEQSSLGDSLGYESPSHNTTAASIGTTVPTTSKSLVNESGSDPVEREEDWSIWQSEVLKRAAQGEGRVVDIQATAARLLEHVQDEQRKSGNGPVHCTNLLSAAEEPVDVSRLFLGTLFLANAGNVEIIQGAPLTLNSFSVVLVSTDERLYRAVASAEQEFLR